ncbi:hypothetical protein SBOR_8387 [Sclerotinia borealis F-4128]|uniref:Uncharacterized protein n=1 Tax=Sclerotinia borealis (strain F-4128) TaxID=1432307 RepID=W9C636_SCLBF|nr:hypothetical protein SBOR_8387 [Sclerotinia borealis F-4128]
MGIILGIQFEATEDGQVVASDTSDGSLWANIGIRLSAVSQLLSGGGLAGSTTDNPPYLFCVPDPNNDNNPYTVATVFAGKFTQGGHLHFWISALKGWIFDSNGATTLCGKISLYAATTKRSTASEIDTVKTNTFDRFTWLCPRAFTPLVGNDGTTKATSAPHSAPLLSTAVAYDSYPSAGTRIGLDTLALISSTLYHELFHLTDAAQTTADPYTKMDDIYEAGGEFHASNVANNPESYVLFALASYIYSNPPTGSPDKVAVVFPGGFSKTID